MGQQLTTATLAIPAAPSPCLSPIRYSLDLSAIHQIHINDKSSHLDEDAIESAAAASHHRSMPADDGSMKVGGSLQWRTTIEEELFCCFSPSVWLKISPRVEFWPTWPTILPSEVASSARPDIQMFPVRCWGHLIISVMILLHWIGMCSWRSALRSLGPEILMQDEDHSELIWFSCVYATVRGCLASAVDFWALGICLYQFLVGVTPFADECPRAIISNILNYRLVWPEEDGEQLDGDAINVIKGLLSYEPSLRLQLDGKEQTLRWMHSSISFEPRFEKGSFLRIGRLGESAQHTCSLHSGPWQWFGYLLLWR